MIEVSIKIKDEEQTLTTKFLLEEGFCVSHDDPALKKIINEAIANFKGKAEDVIIKIRLDW